MIVWDMRSVSSKMEDSMDREVLSYSLTFLAVWWCYSLKWAILILFTLWLVKFTAKNYHNGDILAKKRIRSYQDDRTIKNLEESHGMSDLGNTGRTMRTIRRQYVNPVSAKRDLTFTDLQMNRNSSSRRKGSLLKSPEPLISQVTRHLSFSNMSYYPDRTRNRVLPQVQHQNTTLNTTRPNNSYLLSPIKSPNTSLNDIPSQQKPFLDIRSSPLQARYSPRCFSVLDPTLNMAENPSTVKITQPCESIEGSPLSFESILQKRLQRTKENPCSRQAVLSALVEKSRKRAASETDGSFLEPTYGTKKRRRDDLDDFLDSIADSSSPANVSSGIVKSLKRPHLRSDGEETLFTSLRTDKKLRERHSSSEEQILASIDKSKLKNSDEDENTLNNLSSIACGSTEDSGVVLSGCDETNSEPGKTKKGKSVTFSRDLESQLSSSQDKITHSHEVHSDLSEKPCPTENREMIHAKKSAEFLLGFQTRFSPRKSLHLNTMSPITKAKEKKGHRRSHLTWKDFQENRREAWKRSQKLLDDIEESIAREKGKPSASLVSQTTSSNPSLTDGASKTTAASVDNNVKNAVMPTSNLFGSTTSQGPPATSLSTTSLFPSMINSNNQTSTTSTSLQTSQPLQQINTTGKLTLQTTTTTVLSSQSLPPNLVPNSSTSATPNSGSTFGNKQTGVDFGVKPAASITTTSSLFNFAGGITGTRGDTSSKVGTSEFTFAVPKSPVKKATTATTTISTKPSFGNNFTSSSPFTSFGTSSTGTTAVVQPSTQTTTLSLSTSNFAPTAAPQTTSTQFGFLGNAPSSTTLLTKTNPSTFSLKAPLAGTSSTGLPLTTSSASPFSFKAQPGVPTFGNTAQPTLSSSQSRPTGLFSFTAGSGTAGVFGAAGTQTSIASSFVFSAQNGPGFGTQGSGVTVATAAGQAKPGGFSFTALAVNKPSPIGGFGFGQNQPTPGTFNFGSPAPAASGFTFGGTGGGPGAPFASSTPMPGIAGGVVGGAFALGSLSSGTAGSRQRQRRRKK